MRPGLLSYTVYTGVWGPTLHLPTQPLQENRFLIKKDSLTIYPDSPTVSEV